MEEQLVEAFNKKDDVAWEKVYLSLFPIVVAYTTRFISEERAKDIVNDLFKELWEGEPDFKSIDHLRGHLFKSAKRRAIDELRKDDTVNKNAPMILYLNEQDNNTAYHRDETADLRILNKVYEEIENLSGRRKTVFKMRLLDKLKVEEIAARLNLKTSTIYNTIAAAYRELKKKLGNFPHKKDF